MGFYNIALVAHIAGIAMLAGTTFVDYMLFRQFWKVYADDNTRGSVIKDLLHRLQRYMGVGMLLIIASGVVMMAYLHQVWGKQLWFQVKMGILLVIIINGLGIRRRVGGKLDRLIAGGTPSVAALSGLKRNISIVHIVQLLLFIIVFTLSVFKFN